MKDRTINSDVERLAHPTENKQEAELVAMALGGSEPAVRELVRRLNPRLFRIIRGIVKSDSVAEELVQEAYLIAFTRLDSFRGEARFSTWITRIAINISKMQLRRDRPVEEYDTVNETESSAGTILPFPGHNSDRPETSLGRVQFRQLLEDAISDLPPDFRLPFVMHEVEGMSIWEIAADLQVNPVTVKTRLFRARRKLRTSLGAKIQGGFDEVFPFDGARCASMADSVIKQISEKGLLR